MSIELIMKELTDQIREMTSEMKFLRAGLSNVLNIKQEAANDAEIEVKNTEPTIESLTRLEVAQLAVIYRKNAQEVTEIKVKEVRSRLADSTDLATQQATKILESINHAGGGNIGNPRLLEICQQVATHFDVFQSDDHLNKYVHALVMDRTNDLNKAPIPTLETKAAAEETIEPEAPDIFEQAKELIMKMTTGGLRAKALEILQVFGAKRLGQVPPDKLVEVVDLAKHALSNV